MLLSRGNDQRRDQPRNPAMNLLPRVSRKLSKLLIVICVGVVNKQIDVRCFNYQNYNRC